jgi:phage terminase large subunit-like protein
MLSDSAYKRLWLNIWQPGEGDALDAQLVEAAICRDLTDSPIPGYTYVGGFDAGITSDHAAWVVVGAKPNYPVVHVARVRDWAPNRPVGAGGKLEVDLQEVQDTIRADVQAYGITGVFYDPHECRLSGQQLRKDGINAQEVNFTGKSLDLMARSLLVAFREARIELYNDRLLVNDLMRLTIVERPFGMRLSATRDENGHADRATALAIVLPIALQISELPPRRIDGLGDTLLSSY